MIWIAIPLFLVSLLAVCKPPFYQAWLLSVAVAGLPWLFALISLGVFLSAFFGARDMSGAAAPVVWCCAAAAFFLFCVPVIRAFRMAEPLKREMSKVFPGPGQEGFAPGQPAKAFRFWKMLTGPLVKKVPFQRLVYFRTAPDLPAGEAGSAGQQAPDGALELDFYPSQLEGLRPCVIVIHGGSWSSGNSRQLAELNSRLARSGYHAAALNYRLAPRYQSPSAVEDVRNAIAFLRENSARLRIDSGRLALLGRSAGGQIALQAAYGLCDPGIRGVIAYYAPADMVWGYSAPASRLIMDSCKVMEAYLGGSYSAVPAHYHSASPVETLTRHALPTLLIHGKIDVLVSQEHSFRLAGALAASGTPHYLLDLPGGTHGFDYVLDGPEGQLAAYAAGHFLEAVFTDAS